MVTTVSCGTKIARAGPGGGGGVGSGLVHGLDCVTLDAPVDTKLTLTTLLETADSASDSDSSVVLPSDSCLGSGTIAMRRSCNGKYRNPFERHSPTAWRVILKLSCSKALYLQALGVFWKRLECLRFVANRTARSSNLSLTIRLSSSSAVHAASSGSTKCGKISLNALQSRPPSPLFGVWGEGICSGLSKSHLHIPV